MATTNLKDERRIRTWMRRNYGAFVDPKTGEVNATGLAEEAANTFDLYTDHVDYKIPEEVFELSDEVATWASRPAYARGLSGVGAANQTKEEYEYPSQEELDESVIIKDARRGSGYDLFAEGKHIESNAPWTVAIDLTNAWMERNRYWPNIYFINERGNVALLDKGGNEVASWV